MRMFALATITLLIHSANGQNKTYFGLEFSVANDLYKIDDTGEYLISIPLINGNGGFNVRHEISKRLFIETGLILKYYWEGFGFKTIPYYSSISSENSWIIPLRFGTYLNLYKKKIHFVPIIGYSFVINPAFGYGLGYGTQRSGATVIKYDYTENPDVSRYFSLLQTGLGFEFTIFKTVLFSISTNYYTGFTKIIQLDINYTVNNTSEMAGTAISKGEFWCVSTGLKYPISNFWQNK
jgi:hypothetical protein